jgi:hypothetical protein
MPDNDRYSEERYNSSLAHCHSLSLEFDGYQLLLKGIGPFRSYVAVSGRPDDQGGFDYTQSRQTERSSGPIPAGEYWINPSEIWTNAWYKRASRSAWGNHRITIHPFLTTQTFGRGGFFIHGGAFPGSAGCIDLAGSMDQFVSDLRLALGARTDCQIHLTVSY